MLVRDQDALQILRRAADPGQTLADLTQAEPRVDQHAGLVGLQVGAIPGGTAAQNRQADRHGPR